MRGCWLCTSHHAYAAICVLVTLQTIMGVKLEGGSAVAMAGRGCVVLAMDNRVGTRGQLVSANPLEIGSRVLKVHSRAVVGMVGYDSHAVAFFELLRAELTQRSISMQHHSLGRSRRISPRALSLLISHLLYHDFKSGGVAPIIAGLERTGAPVLCTQDSLGAWSFQSDFAAIGSSAESVLGVCEMCSSPPAASTAGNSSAIGEEEETSGSIIATERSSEELQAGELTAVMGAAEEPPTVVQKPSQPRRRAKLIVDGAHLESCIRAAGEGRKGRLDHLVLLSLLEERLDVSFEKKVLYQATPDGQPNHFHRSISHPDGAHVKTVLQPLKARLVTVEIGGMKQTQELLLDKGVDLALALEILADRDDPSAATGTNPSAAVLVIITADGDLQPVVERAERWGHVVFVCGGRKTLSDRLHEYVKKGSGQAVWLDDLIEQSWVAPRAPSSVTPVAASGVLPPALTSTPRPAVDPLLMMKHNPVLTVVAPMPSVLSSSAPSPKQKLYRCPQGRFCDKVDEPGHLRALRHPCPNGQNCRFANGQAPEMERREHMASFVHICPKGTSCPRNDIEHCTHFDHPYRRTKARCPDGANCPFIARGGSSSNSSAREHSRMYRHPCPKGSNCPLLAGKQPSEKKRYHLMDYTHPCHVGCKYSVDKEWAWQHFSDFDHVEQAPHAEGAETMSNPTTEDEDNDHVILEGGWNYLDDATNMGGASPNAAWAAQQGQAAAAAAAMGGLGGPTHSLFASDFFKPFPAASPSSMGPQGDATALGGASAAGSAASPLRDPRYHHHNQHHQHHGGGHHHQRHEKAPHSPWRQG